MDLPEPLLPSDVDLRDYPDMPFAVQRFRDSGIASTKHPEEVLAALMLWCASWHQVPAASLPATDLELAPLAGYGRGVRDFARVRASAVHRMVKCHDGRLWHPIVAAKAAQSWNSKLRERQRRAADLVRKVNAERRARGEEPLPLPKPAAQLKQDEHSMDGIPRWHYHDSSGNRIELIHRSDGIPLEPRAGSDGILSLKLSRSRSEVNEVQEREAQAHSLALNGHSKERRIATRLPEDWRLPDEWRQWAMDAYGIDAQKAIRISIDFRNYWIALSNNDKARKMNWNATWQRWVAKEMGDR